MHLADLPGTSASPACSRRTLHLPVLKETHVLSATTCDPAWVMSDSSPHLLPRLIDTEHVTDLEFEHWVLDTARPAPASRPLPAGRGTRRGRGSGFGRTRAWSIEHVPEGSW